MLLSKNLIFKKKKIMKTTQNKMNTKRLIKPTKKQNKIRDYNTKEFPLGGCLNQSIGGKH